MRLAYQLRCGFCKTFRRTECRSFPAVRGPGVVVLHLLSLLMDRGKGKAERGRGAAGKRPRVERGGWRGCGWRPLQATKAAEIAPAARRRLPR